MFFRNVSLDIISEEDSNDESISSVTQDQNTTRSLDENEIPLVNESAITVTDNVCSSKTSDSKTTGINLYIKYSLNLLFYSYIVSYFL